MSSYWGLVLYSSKSESKRKVSKEFSYHLIGCFSLCDICADPTLPIGSFINQAFES